MLGNDTRRKEQFVRKVDEYRSKQLSYALCTSYLRPGAIARWEVCPLVMQFNAHVLHILSWRLGHEKNLMAILPLPLIQEEQLSVTGERMSTK